MTLTECRVFLLEVVEDVAKTEAVTRNLVSVGRANAFACGANLLATLGFLVGSVEKTVRGSDELKKEIC